MGGAGKPTTEIAQHQISISMAISTACGVVGAIAALGLLAPGDVPRSSAFALAVFFLALLVQGTLRRWLAKLWAPSARVRVALAVLASAAIVAYLLLPADASSTDDSDYNNDTDRQVHSSGSVTLAGAGDLVSEGVDLNEWQESSSGHLFVTVHALVASGQTQLAPLDDEDASFATCRERQRWSSRVDWDDIDEGDQICVRAEGRYGYVQVDKLLVDSFLVRLVTVDLSGVLWEP